MKHIKLHGILAEKFGEDWMLDIATPAEGLRAINANRPGFFQYLIDSEREGLAYRVMLNDDDLPPEMIPGPFSYKEVFHVIPVIAGASGGTAKIIIGAVIVVAAVVCAAFSGGSSIGVALSYSGWSGGIMSAGTLMGIGVSIMFAGISQLLATNPKKQNSSGSHLFSGPQNTVQEGGPVPVGYGRMLIGSTVISSGIQVTSLVVTAGTEN
jgi:predicted phage tail protein